MQTAAAIFEADWTRGAEPDPGPLVVSPTNAREQLLGAGARGAASRSISMPRCCAIREMLDALAAAAERGVRVRLIVSPSTDFAAERGALAAAGVDIRLSSSLYIHAKVIVADGERAFVGSQNLSATSLDQNRELGIVVDDPVNLARLTRTFEIDFRAAPRRQSAMSEPSRARTLRTLAIRRSAGDGGQICGEFGYDIERSPQSGAPPGAASSPGAILGIGRSCSPIDASGRFRADDHLGRRRVAEPGRDRRGSGAGGRRGLARGHGHRPDVATPDQVARRSSPVWARSLRGRVWRRSEAHRLRT